MMLTGATLLIALAVGAIVGLLLLALLLRSACDLCQVEPSPNFWRCLALAVLLNLIGIPLGFGLHFFFRSVAGSMRLPDYVAPILAVLGWLAIMAVVCTLIFVVAFRVRPLKGAAVWLVNTVISALVGAVLVMLTIGGWTTIEAARRLF